MREVPAKSFRRIVNWGGLIIVLLLPTCFNAYAQRPFEPPKVTFFRWAVALMAVAFVLSHFLNYRRGPQTPSQHRYKMKWAGRRTDHLLSLLVMVYGGAYLLSTALSLDPRQSLWGLGDKHGTVTVLATLVFFFLMRAILRTEEQVDRVVRFMLLGSVPVAFYAMAQFVGLDPLAWTTDSVSPVSSTLGRSNFLGAYFAMLVPFTLAGLLRGDGTDRKPPTPVSSATSRRPWRKALLALLQMICVLISQARAAWLGLIGGVVVFTGTLAYRWRSRTYLLLCLAGLALVMCLFVVLSGTDLQRLAGFSSAHLETGPSFTEMRAGTVKSRLEIWQKTLPLIQERWWIGHGPESFVTVFGSRYRTSNPEGGSGLVLNDPHNLVLDHLVAVGVLGLAAFVSAVGVFYWLALDALRRAKNRRQEALSAAVLGSATAFLIQAQFNPDVIVLSAFFWLVMAIGTARRAAARSP